MLKGNGSGDRVVAVERKRSKSGRRLNVDLEYKIESDAVAVTMASSEEGDHIPGDSIRLFTRALMATAIRFSLLRIEIHFK